MIEQFDKRVQYSTNYDNLVLELEKSHFLLNSVINRNVKNLPFHSRLNGIFHLNDYKMADSPWFLQSVFQLCRRMKHELDANAIDVGNLSRYSARICWETADISLRFCLLRLQLLDPVAFL